ncbi:MAG: hypothetical protein CFH05_01210 [Alphaproteobacteria bacterium MarineAlpha3_Bin4]|nr:MAG: hypothetical protein CFH05_01210 [Alphaproteobacteria bacterium MarineAlpha3_Bin4]
MVEPAILSVTAGVEWGKRLKRALLSGGLLSHLTRRLVMPS